MNDVEVDEAAVEAMLNDIDGPVGRLLTVLSEQVAAVARERVHIRGAHETWNARSTAYPPGWTLASIRSDVHYAPSGKLFGGGAAIEDPTVFLEEPAEQMHERYPFLTTGLDSVWI